MKPNHVLLTMLAALCDKLATTQDVPPAIASEAFGLHQEWSTIVSRYGTPESTAALDGQMEAQANNVGIQMVDLIEKFMAL